MRFEDERAHENDGDGALPTLNGATPAMNRTRWALLGGCAALIFLVAVTGGRRERLAGGTVMSWPMIVLVSLLDVVCILPLELVALRFVFDERPARWSRLRWHALHGAAAITVCVIAMVSTELLDLAAGRPFDAPSSAIVGSLSVYVLFAGVTALAAQRHRQRQRQRTQAVLEEELVHAELDRARLELMSRRADIDPDALFAALDTIARRASTDPAAANDELLRLSAQLRDALSLSDETTMEDAPALSPRASAVMPAAPGWTPPAWLGWTLYALAAGGFLAVRFGVSVERGSRVSVSEQVLLALAVAATLLGGVRLIFHLAWRAVADGWSAVRRTAAYVGLAAAVSLAVVVVGALTQRAAAIPAAPGTTPSAWRLVASVLLNATLVAAAAHIEIVVRRARASRAAEHALQAAVADAELRWTNAALGAVRLQLGPHFLFNALNGVSALLFSDPGEARRVVTDLGALLERVLAHDASDVVPLSQELEGVRLYLGIEGVRFRDRLRVQWDVDAGAQDALVPHLILQPLVENAVKHGIAPRRAPGTIVIGAQCNRAGLRLTVRDDGVGLDASATTRGTGIGVENVRLRLASRHGHRATFSLRAADGGGAIAEIVLPLTRSTA